MARKSHREAREQAIDRAVHLRFLLKRRRAVGGRGAAVQKAEQAGRFDNEAIEREQDAAPERARQLEQQDARLWAALETTNHPPHNNYEAHVVARAALAEADVSYPAN